MRLPTPDSPLPIRARSAGFTLTELLVVIGIIAVLAGLVFVVSRSVRERTDSARCLSNLRQWQVALVAFAGDHDGETPRRGQGVRPVTNTARPEDWFNALPPYAGLPSYAALAQRGDRIKPGDGTIFACPSSKDTHAQCFLPYAMNMNISPTDRAHPHRLAEIVNPSRLVFLADAPGPYSSTLPAADAYSVKARHAGRANVVFMDGHAASFDAAYIGAGTGDPKRTDIQWDVAQEWTD